MKIKPFSDSFEKQIYPLVFITKMFEFNGTQTFCHNLHLFLPQSAGIVLHYNDLFCRIYKIKIEMT